MTCQELEVEPGLELKVLAELNDNTQHYFSPFTPTQIKYLKESSYYIFFMF